MLGSPQFVLVSSSVRVLPRKEFESQEILRAVLRESKARGLRAELHRWIENQRELLSRTLQASDRWGMFRALVLSEGAAADPIDLLRLSGWVHVSSLAGIHLYGALTLFETFVAWVFGRFLGGRSGALRIYADLMTCILGLVSFALQGFRFGFIRPFSVFLLRRFALRAGFRWSTLGPLSLVVVLELLLSRDLEFQGLWHYSLAVGGGLLALESWQKKRAQVPHLAGEIKAHLILSLGSWTPIAIVGVFASGLCAPLTFLQSMLSVSIGCLIWVPVAILCLILFLIGLQEESVWILNNVQDLLYRCLEAFHDLFSAWLLWSLPPSALILGLVLCVTLVGIRNVLGLRVVSVVILGIFLSTTYRVSRSLLWPSNKVIQAVTQLDVRQGDSALVWIRGEIGMIDAGSARAVSISEWIERLARAEVRALDWILLTHQDEDHSGGVGLIELLVPVKKVVTGERLTLHRLPFHTQFISGKSRNNGKMVGVFIQWGSDAAYLNLGDADQQMERKFTHELIPKQWQASHSAIRILKVSHHGSASSTDPDLLKRFSPTEAWISSGAGNRFGHPRVEILRRLWRVGAQVFRTDQHGELRFETK